MARTKTSKAPQQIIRMPFSYVIPSAHNPSHYYHVKDGACDCPSYRYRGACSHLQMVADYEAQHGPAAGTCRLCGRAMTWLSSSGRCSLCIQSMCGKLGCTCGQAA